jgi:hypothetical protein
MRKKIAAGRTVVGLGAVPAAAALLWAIACGGGSKPAAVPEQPVVSAFEGKAAEDGGRTSAAFDTSAVSAASNDNSSAPLAQILVTDPSIIHKIYEAAKSAPTMKLTPQGVTGSDPLARGIREGSMKLPGGMKPDGPLATGTVKEKNYLQTDVSLQPGKCYSIVGYSKQVKDLDLYLFMPPGILTGQDLSDDNKPIIGGPPQPMCPIGSTPLAYKVHLFADLGGGDVAVQLYSKGN